MEFWLMSGNDKFQLPVNPNEISVNNSSSNDTVNSINLGEINLGGKSKLVSLSFSSFFPAQRYDFCMYRNIKTPLESVNLIKKWQEKNSIVRFLVTGTTVNMNCLIENFTPKWQYGTGDIDFQLELKEYRDLNRKANNYYEKTESKYSVGKKNTNNVRTSNKPAQKPAYYIVKSGDTLSAISKRIYGTTIKWKEIAKKNGIKDPTKLRIGQKLVL